MEAGNTAGICMGAEQRVDMNLGSGQTKGCREQLKKCNNGVSDESSEQSDGDAMAGEGQHVCEGNDQGCNDSEAEDTGDMDSEKDNEADQAKYSEPGVHSDGIIHGQQRIVDYSFHDYESDLEEFDEMLAILEGELRA
jgi:hypothetical protein